MRLYKHKITHLCLGMILYIFFYFLNLSYFVDEKITIPKKVFTTMAKIDTTKKNDVIFQIENKANINLARDNTVLPFANFTYALDVDMEKLVETYKKDGVVNEKVINPFTYKYVTNPFHKCTGKKNKGKADTIYILFIVKSSYKHIAQRDAIRQTWGNENYMKYFNIRTVFVLGLPPDGTNPGVNREWQKHRDILQVDFADTYMNNTLKMMAAVFWTTEFCAHAQFLILVDDDFYVALESLIILLQKLPSELQESLYLGNTFTYRSPSREKGYKWYVSPAEYPFEEYPPYINAGTIVMSMDFVKNVRIAMPYTAFFRFDDIYMSIVAYKLGVAPIGSRRFCNCKIVPKKEYLFNYIVSSHGYTPREMLSSWKLHYKRPYLTSVMDI